LLTLTPFMAPQALSGSGADQPGLFGQELRCGCDTRGVDRFACRIVGSHALLRKRLCLRTDSQSHEAFAFHASACDRVVKAVFEGLEFRGESNETR
jgi:hypothetical protein